MTPLEAARAHVPGCGPGSPEPRLCELPGGLGNRALRVRGTAGAFVLRLGQPAALARRLGVDRRAEIAAQAVAAAAGIAPALQFADPDAGLLVMDYVDGEAPPPDWPADAGWCEAFAQLLRVLRGLPVPAAVPRVVLPERLLELHARLRDGDPAVAATLDDVVDDGLRGWREAGAGAGAGCLVHGDPNPANVLRRADGRLVLLDWEYTHAGDPLEDPAALAAEETRAAWLVAAIDGARPRRLAGIARCQLALARVWEALRRLETGAAGGG